MELEPQNQARQKSAITVSDLNRKVKFTLESEFPSLMVKGEISNFTAHRSGHWYFSLKDQKSQIMGVMFRGNNAQVKFKPKNGDEVMVRARVAVYEPRGNYQLVCESMEAVGAGDLQRQFEELKTKLAAEGLFDSARKQSLPKFPKQLAVVTSPTGAAIRDILNVLERRYKGLEVTIFPCKVQGDLAAKEVREQVARVNELGYFDVMIVGRGGGSIEDLWCFNDEALAREISMSSIPVISAVGHEIDFTISDFVADLRAPTPSAAAEMVSANSSEWVDKINQLKNRLWRSIQNQMLNARNRLASNIRLLGSPEQLLESKSQKLDDLGWRLEQMMKQRLQRETQGLAKLRASLQSPSQKLKLVEQRRLALNKNIHSLIKQILRDKAKQNQEVKHLSGLFNKVQQAKTSELRMLMGKLDSLSPLKVLERGYSITLKDGEAVISNKQLSPGDEVEIRLHEGSVKAELTKV